MRARKSLRSRQNLCLIAARVRWRVTGLELRLQHDGDTLSEFLGRSPILVGDEELEGAEMTSALQEQNAPTVIGLHEWERRVATNFARVRIDAPESNFTAAMHCSSLEGIQLVRVNAPKHVVQRTAKHIGPSERSRFVLCIQLDGGQSAVIQDGKQAVLSPGDMAVYDTSRPYTLLHEDGVNCIGVVFQESRVNLAHSAIHPLTAITLSGEDVLTATTASAFDRFEQIIEGVPNPVRHRMGLTFVSLFETLCLNWSSRDLPQELDPRIGLREAIVEYIDSHLADPDLNPQRIADAHYISLRSLHLIAQQSGVTVAGLVRRKRLLQCQADLADPGLTHATVAQIGARWGFTQPSHFNTLFRSEFGITPSAYRKQQFGS